MIFSFAIDVRRKITFVLAVIVLAAAIFAGAEDSFFDRQLDKEIRLLRDAVDRPEAFVYLYSIWDRADYARWDGRIPTILTEVLASPKAPPLLKGHAVWFLRAIDLRTGDLEGAKEKQEQLGFVTDWLIIGPFDNEGMAGFDLTYPPETELELTQTYSGKERPVAWREYPKVSFPCYVDFAATLRPATSGTAYALAFVFSAERQPVALRLGSDDRSKVWLGDVLTFADTGSHSLGFDQAVVPSVLEKGWNTLLVKVCQEDGDWGFRLRVTKPDGSGLTGLTVAAGSEEVAKALVELPRKNGGTPSASGSEEVSPVADPIAEFGRLVKSDPKNPAYRAALSFLYSHAKDFDRVKRQDVQELEAAIELAPDDWKLHFALGYLYEDKNKKRAAYERALELNPDYAPAYSNLGEQYAGRKLDRKATDLFCKAIEKDSSFYPAILGLAEQDNRSSQKARAAERQEELLTAYPDTPFLLSHAAKFKPLPLTPAQVEKRCQTALRFRFGDQNLRNTLFSIYVNRGDFDAALRQLELIEKTNPLKTSALLNHARFLSNRGELDGAMELVDCALKICPEDDLAVKQKGEILLERGELEDALSDLENSYALKPQNRPLREYIEFLKPKEKPFEDDYKVDAVTLVKETASDSGSSEDSAEYLSDLWISQVHPNGLTNSYHQEIVKINSEAGVEGFRFRRSVYQPTTHEVQIKAARVFKKDGRIINADGPFSYTYGGEDKIYYDLESKYVRFSTLEPGDTIEFAYRTNAITPRNLYGDYFGDIVHFKDVVSKRVMRYVVLAPAAKELFYQVVGIDVEPSIETRTDQKVYLWRKENIPKLESEPLMPGYSEVLPYLHISTYRSWEAVGDWYWNLIRDQLLLDAAAKAEVLAITRDLKTEQEKIVAIYNYVVQNTRYIGLEFGIHGHKPYPSYKVYLRKFGDCKDKAGLMVAMLKEIGVEACMSVIRTKSRGAIAPQPASLAVFNHAICYIPKYDLWLDGTAEYSGSTELPYEDQGTCTLIVGEGVRKFVTTSILGSEHNTISDVFDASILPDGGIAFQLAREAIGQYAPYFRQSYEEEKDRETSLAKTWGTTLPNIKISDLQFESLKDLEKPVRYGFKASAQNYAVSDESGALAFSGFIQKLLLTRVYAALSERKHDVALDFPWSMKTTAKFALPAGYGVLSLPENLDLETPFGKCVIAFAKEEALSVSVSLDFSMNVVRVKPEEYGAFREFCRQVDAKQIEKIRIAK